MRTSGRGKQQCLPRYSVIILRGQARLQQRPNPVRAMLARDSGAAVDQEHRVFIILRGQRAPGMRQSLAGFAIQPQKRKTPDIHEESQGFRLHRIWR